MPGFRRYVTGQALSLIGTRSETVAQALLVLHLTPSGTVLGLTTAARYAPILLLSPYAGLLVDRHPRRHVLPATQAGLGLVSASLGASAPTGNARMWQVVALALLFGALSAVDNPARQAFVPVLLLPPYGRACRPVLRTARAAGPGPGFGRAGSERAGGRPHRDLGDLSRVLLAASRVQAGVVVYEDLRVASREEPGVPLPVLAVGEAEPLLAARLQRHAHADRASGM